ncbi:MAG: HEPN domain-containing protein [Acidobacteriia bacterium]|nr:HEPN domain-containing protein [Terriglobia bacterium]
MTPAEWRLDETRQWVRRAENDRRLADLCAAALPAESLFHSQQAARKYLKAFLTWNQTPFRKTHQLHDLGQACMQIDPTLGPALEPAYALSRYAWLFRYPGAPYEPDAAEAAEGRALAERVRSAVAPRLPAAT